MKKTIIFVLLAAITVTALFGCKNKGVTNEITAKYDKALLSSSTLGGNKSYTDAETKVTGTVKETFPGFVPVYEITPRTITEEEKNAIISLIDMDRFQRNMKFIEHEDNILSVRGETVSTELLEYGSFDISDDELKEKALDVLHRISFIEDDYQYAGIYSTRKLSKNDETYILRKGVCFRRYLNGIPVSGDDKIVIEFTKLGLEGIMMNLYNYKNVGEAYLIPLDEAYKKVNTPDGFTVEQESGEPLGKCETLEVQKVRLTYFNQNRSGARILQPIYDFKGIATDGNGVSEEFTSSVIAMQDKYFN
ncbi:MAG: hypothetical protein J5874_01215 [Oscillospiraceae bacterium]|nr:hypothetical protein [Oscillospiraceae bacterium]